MEIDKIEVGHRINSIRERLGLSMTEFGKRIDDTAKSGTINNWVRGKNLPNNERLKRIAELGNISVDELLHGTTEERVSSIIMKKIHDNVYPFNEVALEETIESAKILPDNFLDSEDKVILHYLIEYQLELMVKNEPIITEMINEFVLENNLVSNQSALEKTVKYFYVIYTPMGVTDDLFIPPFVDESNKEEVISVYLDYSKNEITFNKKELKLIEDIATKYLYKKQETKEITDDEMNLLLKIEKRMND